MNHGEHGEHGDKPIFLGFAVFAVFAVVNDFMNLRKISINRYNNSRHSKR